VDKLRLTTRTLLVRIGSLLRDNPVLALPVLIADTLSFVAMHLQHALHDPLLGLLLAQPDSVLSSPRHEFVLTAQNATKAFWMMAPLIWGCYLLTMYLYTTALMITSDLVNSVIRGEASSLRISITRSMIHKVRAFRFALRVFAIAAVAAGAASLLLFMSMNVPWLARRMGADLGYVIGMIVELPALYVLVAPAIRLLRTANLGVSTHINRLGAVVGVAFVVLQGLLLMLINHVLPDSLFQQRTVPGFLVRQWVISLVGASLYVPIFIAISLLAAEIQAVPTYQQVSIDEPNF
jgi:hypothetical protein